MELSHFCLDLVSVPFPFRTGPVLDLSIHKKGLNVIHFVFQSKPLSRSQLFLSLPVSCKRICPTPRANYSLFQDFVFFTMTYFFLRKHLAKTVPFRLCLFCAHDRELSVEFQEAETKHHLVWALAQLSPRSPQRWEQTVHRIHLFGVCNKVFRPMLIIQPPRIQLYQYPLSFIFHFVFSSLWEGRWTFPQTLVTVTLETSTERHALLILKGSNYEHIATLKVGWKFSL